MEALGCSPLFLYSILILFTPFDAAVSQLEAAIIAHRQLPNLAENGDLPDDFEYDVKIDFEPKKPRLPRACIALRPWKHAIYSDPFNISPPVGPAPTSVPTQASSPRLPWKTFARRRLRRRPQRRRHRRLPSR
ncbi:hypothetical protein HPP92_021064 [Vanilla planifolia]|uniref:Uncharacterized protein n=1 Tax=Vanilla planifolia TaxID=51239 RepID=A0A835Q4V4_VANPL|nr:hypothetical protein HPP92_021367 [Vanilla planifolia]KAG0462588.1 hypothetical protein HPP92_021064 [Vanilla planifolia]